MSGYGQLAAAAGTCWLVVEEGGAAYWRKDWDGTETTTVRLTDLWLRTENLQFYFCVLQFTNSLAYF